MATSKMAISKMAFHFGKCVQAQLCFRIFIGPAAIYWKVTNIVLDSPPGSYLESIVVVVGGIHTSVNLLLSDWYTNGWHRTKLAF